MPRGINDVKLESLVTPFQSVGKAPGIDKTASDFDNANLKVNKILRLIEWGIYDVDTACYIPGMLDLVFQGMKEKIMTIEQTADTTYSNKEILKFELILDNNYYTNLKIFHLCFPIRFKKLSNIAYNSDADIYTVNNFFAH